MGGIVFTGIRAWRASFRLRLPFSHHLATRDRVATLILELKTSGGGVGYGQALPRSYLTGEDLESVLGSIREAYWPALKKTAFPKNAGWEDCLSLLAPLYREAAAGKRTAAYAAVDLAALAALASEQGKPLSPPALAGGAGERLPLVAVLPAIGPGKISWLVRIMLRLGYRRFKIKVGRDEKADNERLAAFRRAAGPGVRLSVDANGAWTREGALRRREAFLRHGVGLVEEPLGREEAAGADFARLERELGLPIMADESLCSRPDAERLLARGSPSWWNLRFAKIGGFSGWSELSRLAGENGIKIYGGILVGETSLLAAAARAIWPGSGAVCGEYGFPRIFLAGDPFRGGPGGFRGSWGRAPGRKPGLGVSVNPDRLARAGELAWRDGE
ncbi:MAG: hypothetical protein LBU64_09565 [Planctomycetota bacterium]|nr:hypothetical protein [Planctomycetota bacterium]